MSDEDDFMLSANEDDFDFGYDSGGDNEGEDDAECVETSAAYNASGDNASVYVNDSVSQPLKKTALEPKESLENIYYRGKAHREDNKSKSVELFQQVISTEPDGEQAVKAAKQLLKLLDSNDSRVAETVKALVSAVLYSKLPPLYKESSLCGALERLVQRGTFSPAELCQLTLSMFPAYDKAPHDSHLRLRTRLHLLFARLLLSNPLPTTGSLIEESASVTESSDIPPKVAAIALLNSVHALLGDACTSTDSWQAGVYVESLALKMQLAMEEGCISEAEDLYYSAQDIKTQLVHPRTQAIIREVGGTLALRRERWSAAKDRFFICFKYYDEAGAQARLRILRYYALASLLTEPSLDPFALQETMVYRDAPELRETVAIVAAFNKSDAPTFQSTCEALMSSSGPDTTIVTVMPALRLAFARQTLLELTRLYHVVKVETLASKIVLSTAETKSLLTSLILDGFLAEHRFDEINEVLERCEHGAMKLPLALLDSRERLVMKEQGEHEQQQAKAQNSEQRQSSPAARPLVSARVALPEYFLKLREARNQSKTEHYILRGPAAQPDVPVAQLHEVADHREAIRSLLTAHKQLQRVLSNYH